MLSSVQRQLTNIISLTYISLPRRRRYENNTHWYDEGSSSGSSDSEGIVSDGPLLTVQCQARFLVENNLKMKHIIITEIFNRWYEMLLFKSDMDE